MVSCSPPPMPPSSPAQRRAAAAPASAQFWTRPQSSSQTPACRLDGEKNADGGVEPQPHLPLPLPPAPSQTFADVLKGTKRAINLCRLEQFCRQPLGQQLEGHAAIHGLALQWEGERVDFSVRSPRNKTKHPSQTWRSTLPPAFSTFMRMLATSE